MVDLLGVGQLHYGSIWYRLAATHGSGLYALAMPANGYFFSQKTFLITWRNRWCGDIVEVWAILEHIFVFLRNLYYGGYLGRQHDARNFFLITWPNRWCGDIVVTWAIVGHILVLLRNVYCGGYFGRQAWRTNKQTKTKKTSRKSNFLPGGLAHGPEIFRVDAAFVAAHFPPRVVWGPNPTNGVISPKRPKPRPLFEK